MGQGGFIVLVNGTKYVWDRTGNGSYQMEWDFGKDEFKVVQPYSTTTVYVEAEDAHVSPKDDSGWAEYTMRGSPYKFTIRASFLNLRVSMNNIPSRNAANGSEVGLGMISNRKSYMVISGEGGDFGFHSVGEVHNWMAANLDRWQDRTLRQLCVLSSHDAGMSQVTWRTALAAPTSIATQYSSVYYQLMNGVRYFDIRPVSHHGQWVSGHYTFVDHDMINAWQGGDGQSIQSIVEEINYFTATHRELIVLSVSHVQMINDRGTLAKLERGDFHDLKPEEWNDLQNRFDGIQHRWNKSANDLTKVPLKDFIGAVGAPGESAVLILFDNNVDISNRIGMFHNSAWPWGASDWTQSKTESSKPDALPFSYSGCHTQTDEEAIMCTLGQDSNSILSLSEAPKNKVFTELFPACTETMHPCAISMDAIQSSDLAALCLAINDRSKKQG